MFNSVTVNGDEGEAFRRWQFGQIPLQGSYWGSANLRQYVRVAPRVSPWIMIPSNKAAKAVVRHIPQLNKKYRAATTKPMKGLASQPKQQPLFSVSLIFHKPLEWSTLCLPPLRWQCRLETCMEMSCRMKCCEINWSTLTKPTDKPHLDGKVNVVCFCQYPLGVFIHMCLCWSFCSAHILQDRKPMQLCKNSRKNKWRALCSCLRSPRGSILTVRVSVSLTENMLLAHLSSTFLWLLCKVKAVILRTCCSWLDFTKGSGWKPPTHTKYNTLAFTYRETSLTVGCFVSVHYFLKLNTLNTKVK